VSKVVILPLYSGGIKVEGEWKVGLKFRPKLTLGGGRENFRGKPKIASYEEGVFGTQGKEVLPKTSIVL
jgi:hypothetical protein